MQQKLAQAAMEFMRRTELKGKEVPAWNEVMQALSEYAFPQEKPNDTGNTGDGATAKGATVGDGASPSSRAGGTGEGSQP